MPLESKKYKVDRDLEEWLLKRKPSDFPETIDKRPYTKIYESTRGALEPIQREAATGALVAEILNTVEDGKIKDEQISYLNNHGPEHVKTVIKRASQILTASECELTAYEGYLLLMAIQFHDVGIIYGRENHQITCWEIMRRLDKIVGGDATEKQYIIKLAAVHCGNIQGNKDTISILEEDIDLMDEQGIRLRFLAALLRFSDELADDRNRASRFMLEGGNIPEDSEIYHAYSCCLNSVMLTKNEISLVFFLDSDIALKTYKKKNEKKFIIDEIYSRTMKMHIERIYCSRFLRPFIDLKKIIVKINVTVFEEDVLADKEVIKYTLSERGYPSDISDDITLICPELKYKTGELMEKKILNQLQGSLP